MGWKRRAIRCLVAAGLFMPTLGASYAFAAPMLTVMPEPLVVPVTVTVLVEKRVLGAGEVTVTAMGVLMATLVVSYTHTNEDIARTLDALDASLAIYKRALQDGVERYLVGPPSQTVYRKFNNPSANAASPAVRVSI